MRRRSPMCMLRPMDLGIALPTSGALASPANIARVAREAEQLEYAAVWTYERLLRPLSNVPTRRGGDQLAAEAFGLVYEPLETLSYVSAVTSRIKLGTSIINALFHPPVVLARRFATLDQFSDGRVIVGLGQGWMPQEFETVNVPMQRRGSGMDEMVAAMRACWGPDPVAYEGRFYRIAPSIINPKPVQAHLPILIGAMTPGGVKRAARIADGLNVIADSLDVVNNLVAIFREEVTAAGRNPAKAPIVIRSNGPVTSDPMGADRPFLAGSPRQIADDLAKLTDTKVDHVLFENEDGARDLEEGLRLFDQLRVAAAAVI
jgi:probable F420-dependent oxidoreductase